MTDPTSPAIVREALERLLNRVSVNSDDGKFALAALAALDATPGEGESRVKCLGDNWDQTGRVVMPLSMGPKLSPQTRARLDEVEKLNVAALVAACKFPIGARFAYHDEEGEHDPAYVVMPDGGMLPVNHYNDGDAQVPTDCARAAFIVAACNDKLASLPAAPLPGRVVLECPASPLPSGKHQLDTSMESGPNNCFFCDQPMGAR